MSVLEDFQRISIEEEGEGRPARTQYGRPLTEEPGVEHGVPIGRAAADEPRQCLVEPLAAALLGRVLEDVIDREGQHQRGGERVDPGGDDVLDGLVLALPAEIHPTLRESVLAKARENEVGEGAEEVGMGGEVEHSGDDPT